MTPFRPPAIAKHGIQRAVTLTPATDRAAAATGALPLSPPPAPAAPDTTAPAAAARRLGRGSPRQNQQQQRQSPPSTSNGASSSPPPPPPPPLVHWRAGAWRLTHHDPTALAAASRTLAARLRAGVMAERDAEREAVARLLALGSSSRPGGGLERLERDGAVLARLGAPAPAGALYGQQKWAVARADGAALPPHHRFRAGDPVLLSSPMGGGGGGGRGGFEEGSRKSGASSFDATVLEVARDRVVLALENAAGVALAAVAAAAAATTAPPRPGRAAAPPALLWRLDRAPSDAAAQRQLDAIARLEADDGGGWVLPPPPGSEARGGGGGADAFEVLLRACLVGAPEAVLSFGDGRVDGGADEQQHRLALLERVASTPPPWVRDAAWRARAVALLGQLPGLNDSQRAAVAAALTRTLTLWQGPPGTGKTRTCLALIEVLVRASEVEGGGGEGVAAAVAATTPNATTATAAAAAATAASAAAAIPVLAVADTNAAADNLVEGLASRGLRVVRVGGAARVRPSLRHLSIEAQAEATPLGERAAEGRARSRALFAQARYLRQRQWLEQQQQEQQQQKPQQQQQEEAPAPSPSPLPLEAEARREWAMAERLARAAARSVLEHAQVVAATCNAAGDGSLLALGGGGEEEGGGGGKRGGRGRGRGAATAAAGPLAFRAVVIDEATQATEPATLVPLVRGAQMAVLAGDPRQLPPTVVSRAALGPPALLGRTLFDRLSSSSSPSPSLGAEDEEEVDEEARGRGEVFNPPPAAPPPPPPPLLQPRLLDRQYRMHPALARFPSQRFYGGLLKDGVAASARPAPRGVRWPSSRTPAVVLCVEGGEGERRDDDDVDDDDDGSGDDDGGRGTSSGGGGGNRRGGRVGHGNTSSSNGGGGSYRNAAEAQQCLRALRALLSGGGDVRSVAVLSPYRGQVRLIERLLRARGPAAWLERAQRRLEREMTSEAAAATRAGAEAASSSGVRGGGGPTSADADSSLQQQAAAASAARLNGLGAPFAATPLVTVSSVDGFQGREADAVVLSVVRSNRRGGVGFVADPRRLCVAASRARRALVVVCSERTLRASGSADWGAFLDWAEKEGVVVRPPAAPRAGGRRAAPPPPPPWPLVDELRWDDDGL